MEIEGLDVTRLPTFSDPAEKLHSPSLPLVTHKGSGLVGMVNCIALSPFLQEVGAKCGLCLTSFKSYGTAPE